jgi:hypothetical protein
MIGGPSVVFFYSKMEFRGQNGGSYGNFRAKSKQLVAQAKIRRKGFPAQSQTFEKKADAEAWARDIENKMDRGKLIFLSLAWRVSWILCKRVFSTAAASGLRTG